MQFMQQEAVDNVVNQSWAMKDVDSCPVPPLCFDCEAAIFELDRKVTVFRTQNRGWQRSPLQHRGALARPARVLRKVRARVIPLGSGRLDHIYPRLIRAAATPSTARTTTQPTERWSTSASPSRNGCDPPCTQGPASIPIPNNTHAAKTIWLAITVRMPDFLLGQVPARGAGPFPSQHRMKSHLFTKRVACA